MQRTKLFFAGTLLITLLFIGMALGMAKARPPRSGMAVGGLLPAYHMKHVSGADKKTYTCPLCKYQTNPAVQVWVNTDDEKNVARIIAKLEVVSKAHADKKFKAFVVFLDADKHGADALGKHLEALAATEKLQNVALTYLPDREEDAVTEYEINTDTRVKNTVFVYKERKIVAKFVNLIANQKGLDTLQTAIEGILK